MRGLDGGNKPVSLSRRLWTRKCKWLSFQKKRRRGRGRGGGGGGGPNVAGRGKKRYPGKKHGIEASRPGRAQSQLGTGKNNFKEFTWAAPKAAPCLKSYLGGGKGIVKGHSSDWLLWSGKSTEGPFTMGVNMYEREGLERKAKTQSTSRR